MAKAKGEKPAKDDKRKGRPPNSPSGRAQTSTYRVSPAGIRQLQGLSDRLRLKSQALAIELGANQLAAALAACDADPPLPAGQLVLAADAVRAAGVSVRRLGAAANFTVVLTAAVLAHEGAAVAAGCTPAEFAAVTEAVRRLNPVESIWVLDQAADE